MLKTILFLKKSNTISLLFSLPKLQFLLHANQLEHFFLKIHMPVKKYN